MIIRSGRKFGWWSDVSTWPRSHWLFVAAVAVPLSWIFPVGRLAYVRATSRRHPTFYSN